MDTLSEILETDNEHQLLFSLFFHNFRFDVDYSTINYNRLLQLITKKHRIINHFYDKADLSCFPEEFISRLKIERIKQKQNALKQLSILIEIKNVLPENSFIVLKGLPLSQQLYNDFAYRDSSDVDILIEPKNEKQIIELLVNKGFSRSHNYEHHYVLKRYGISVEVHRKLSQIFKTKEIEKNAWSNSLHVVVENNKFRVMDNNSQYNYLLINASTHYWRRLSYMLDIYNYNKYMGEIKFNPQLKNLVSLYNFLITNGIVDSYEKKTVVRYLFYNQKFNIRVLILRTLYFMKISNFSPFFTLYKRAYHYIKNFGSKL